MVPVSAMSRAKIIAVKFFLAVVGAALGICVAALGTCLILDAIVSRTVKAQDVTVGEGILVIGGTYIAGICGGALGLIAGVTFPVKTSAQPRISGPVAN